MSKKDITGQLIDAAGEDEVVGSNRDELARIAELTTDLQRTRADFENFRKQAEARERLTAMRASERTMMTILPLLDEIRAATQHYPEQLGVLQKSIGKALEELDLEVVGGKIGAVFDPEEAEAVAVEGEGEKEVIGEVLRAGYKYRGELLRPAMVKVVKK